MDEQLFPKQQGQQGTQQIASVAGRLKMAEERYQNLLKRNQLNEESLLDLEKGVRADLKMLTQQLVELKRRIAEITQKVDAMGGELSSVVQKHEFTALERYVEMWQPMTFLTKEDAKRILERNNA